MQNGIFKLDYASISDAVVTSVVLAIGAAFLTIVGTENFSVFSANWSVIGKQMVDIGFIAGTTSLIKDLLTTSDGRLLGLGNPSVPTPPQPQG